MRCGSLGFRGHMVGPPSSASDIPMMNTMGGKSNESSSERSTGQQQGSSSERSTGQQQGPQTTSSERYAGQPQVPQMAVQLSADIR